MSFDLQKLKTFPQKPGVYIMKGPEGSIIYIGKAKDLFKRIKQYFQKGGDGRYMVPFLVSSVETIDTIVVSSEKEALLLENNLIKKHKPKYNALLKDDKSYIALKITKHKWPRVDIVRYRGKPKADGIYFGPYTSAASARKTLDLIHKIFPLRQCSDAEFLRRVRPCILYGMKRCIAPCVGYCTKEEYDLLTEKLIRFLRGKNIAIIKDLYAEMHKFAKELEFEKAKDILTTIRQVERTIEKQNVDKPFGINGDALGIYREGLELVLVLLFYRDGRLQGASHFTFSNIAQDDIALIQSFLCQHYERQEDMPKEILLPIKISQAKAISDIISKEKPVSIFTPRRGQKLAYVNMAKLNAETTFKKENDRRSIREKMLLSLQEVFKLANYPRKIECIDISNLSGQEFVASIVSFTDGEKDKKRYRKYKIRDKTIQSDTAAMLEVLLRRFEKEDLPDLLIVDGGKGQLNTALKVFKKLNIISVDVIGLAKEKSRHDKGLTGEKVYLPNVKNPKRLAKRSTNLFLLQKIRDEAHRFAITFQRKIRSKKLIKSILDDIAGIGPAKRKKLIKHFGSVQKIKEAKIEDIKKVPGISIGDAEAVFSFLTG